ncbi:GDSL-type esterase/lipase family protein [Oscillatoria sp. FACHB-1407]|uniref:GDSL-type esterase/lipase family protein n=1 Tax=Oscillatoria sp. FACHB-1407 TaxID=2692847 RepID=UPI001F54C401|nr:GDSL-type esterase/lipase family protein [Oscillatoria sp. FACHB-1407]
MGDLSLLAASLLHHSSVAKEYTPPNLAIAAIKSIPSGGETGQTVVVDAMATTATHSPEFSSVGSGQADPGTSSSSAQPVVPQPRLQPVASPAEDRIAQIVPLTQRQSSQRIQNITSPTRIAPAIPQTSILQPPVWVEPSTLPTPDFSAPNPTTVSPSTLRPRSGSQLYRQRVVALRSGRTYTRLPANSFWESWSQATQQPTYEQWVSLLAQEAGAMARGQGSNRLTILLGDSLYLWYPSEQLAGDRFWLNQGISGDTTAGVLRRLSAFANTRPDTIHVMVGINDLRRGATDAEVINNSRQIMRQLRRNHPNAEIIIHSILPTRLAAIPSSRIHRINTTIAAIAKQERVDYLDLLGYFADAQGDLRRDLTTDGLHLNPRGYATWQWAMANG